MAESPSYDQLRAELEHVRSRLLWLEGDHAPGMSVEDCQRLYEHAPCGYHSLDAQGLFLRINDTELAWLGYAREELVGKRGLRDLLTPESQARFDRRFEAFKHEGRLREAEFEMIRKDGSTFPVIVNADALYDREGRFVMSDASVFDISQHKATEDALVAREALLQTIIEGTPDPIYIKDTGGRFLLVNAACAGYFGLPVASIVGRRDVELHAPEVGKRAQRDDQQVIEAGVPLSFENTVRHADGVERTYMVTKFPYRADGGPVRGVVGIARDITAMRRHEQELEAANRRLQRLTCELAARQAVLDHIIDDAPVAIIYFDRELVIRRANPLIARLLGIPLDRLLDRPVGEVFPSLDLERHYGPVLARGETVRIDNFEHRYEVEGIRHVRHWDLINVPIHSEDGAVAGILGMAVEVSDRVRREEVQLERITALEETEKLKDQFLSILSHELRTPINAIMGFGSILEDGLAGPLSEEQQGFVQQMLEGAERMLGLVSDLLDMSRIQAGQFTLAPEAMAFAPAVRQVLSQLGSLAARRGLALECDLDEALPPVMADPQRVGQVLTNLIGNAIKFTKRGTITVRAWPEGERLRCEVSDTGPGIAAGQLGRIFEPFTQADMSMTRTAGGTGLGLPISRALVEAHGGLVGVRTTPGQGATFWFTLPLAR